MNTAKSSEYLKILSRLSVFQGLDDAELQQVASFTQKEKFGAGEIVFEDASHGVDLYVVLSGKVNVQIESIIPNELLFLSTIRPGEIFGEFALVDEEPRSATALCTMDSEMLIVNGHELNQLFQENYHIGYIVIKNIARTISSRIRRTNRMLLSAIRNRAK